MQLSNNPPVLVELTQEQAEFLKNNCETNIAFGLAALQDMEKREAAEKIVNLIEAFKGIKQAVEKAL